MTSKLKTAKVQHAERKRERFSGLAYCKELSLSKLIHLPFLLRLNSNILVVTETGTELNRGNDRTAIKSNEDVKEDGCPAKRRAITLTRLIFFYGAAHTSSFDTKAWLVPVCWGWSNRSLMSLRLLTALELRRAIVQQSTPAEESRVARRRSQRASMRRASPLVLFFQLLTHHSGTRKTSRVLTYKAFRISDECLCLRLLSKDTSESGCLQNTEALKLVRTSWVGNEKQHLWLGFV